MNRQLLLHTFIIDEKRRFDTIREDCEKLLTIMPKGSLLDRNGHPYHAYRENGHRYQVPIKNMQLLDELSLRRHLKAGLPAIQKRADLCKYFLKNEVFYDPVQIHQSLPAIYSSSLDPLLFPEGDIDPMSWISQPYKRNPAPFSNEHYTSRGIQVRSKSEALIGSELEQRGMLFQCEPEFRCGNTLYYPDYKILLPLIRRIVYLEHFGMMDDPDYLKKAMRKLHDYPKHGLYLGYNFFFTWETSYHPLNMKEVHEILDVIQSLDFC